jgi:DNA-binding CsgD family transcriptional regulator
MIERELFIDSEENSDTKPKDLLTPRQIEILGYAAKGYSDLEISKILNISDHTVDQHLYRPKTGAIAKLNASGKIDAVVKSVSQNILNLDELFPDIKDLDLTTLTPRDIEIYRLLSNPDNSNKSYKQLAYDLGVVTQTFKNASCRLYKKLGVRGRMGTVTLALLMAKE